LLRLDRIVEPGGSRPDRGSSPRAAPKHQKGSLPQRSGPGARVRMMSYSLDFASFAASHYVWRLERQTEMQFSDIGFLIADMKKWSNHPA
jgi:hypothetical protein